MQKIIVILFVIVIAGFAIFLLAKNDRSTKISIDTGEKQTKHKTNENMKITTSAFNHNEKIPSKYTCDGDNVNPQLDFDGVPLQARSLVLIMDDPDAPAKTWVHWVVYNINPRTTEVKENSVPEGGIEGMTDFGNPGYGGPCPPSGTHRYFFKLYALDSALDLPQNATKQMVEEKMQKHIIDKTELIGLYSRS